MYDFSGKVISPGYCSTETPINHYNEPLSSIMNFQKKLFLKELAKSEDAEKPNISSNQTHMTFLLPQRSLLE